MSFAMKEDKLLRPHPVRFFGSERKMPNPARISHLLFKARLALVSRSIVFRRHPPAITDYRSNRKSQKIPI
jgi:hypothetical protein